MKSLLLLPLLLFFQFSFGQKPYLQIDTDRNDYIVYPPQTDFEVYNTDNQVIFTQADLSEGTELKLKGPHKIKLSVDWGNGENIIDVDNARIRLKKPTNFTEKVDEKKFSTDSWATNQPLVTEKAFILNDDGTYDAHIVFEDNIRFVYRDGEAIISEDGEALRLLGKFVAKTSAGYLKFSYNPSSKEYWYVFTDTYKKIIYK